MTQQKNMTNLKIKWKDYYLPRNAIYEELLEWFRVLCGDILDRLLTENKEGASVYCICYAYVYFPWFEWMDKGFATVWCMLYCDFNLYCLYC